jgi:hypothetical protein
MEEEEHERQSEALAALQVAQEEWQAEHTDPLLLSKKP